MLPGQPAQPIHYQVTEGFLCRGRGGRISPGFARKAFVGLVEIQVAVVGQGILQGDLMARRTAFDQLIERGKICREGRRPETKALEQGMRAVAVVVARIRVPSAGEGVDAHHRVVVRAERLPRIEQGIAIGIGDQPLDAGSPEDLCAPSRS